MNEFAKEAKNKAAVTSVAPNTATCLKLKRRNTGPFARPIRLVRAWFMLIIVVICADGIPSSFK